MILPDTESPEFDSTATAAHAFANKLATKSGDANEAAGLIYKKPNGKFVYSTQVSGASDKFEVHAGLPKGHTIAGILHTHPSDDPESQVFSPADIDVAKTMNVPSYVKFLHDDTMRVYVPGKTQTRKAYRTGSPFGLTVARGDDVPAPEEVQTSPPPVTTQDPPPTTPPFAALAPLGNSGGTLGGLAQVAH